ncbi:palmitoyltransferase ZDHHC20-B-like [Amblyomma americanum]
MATSSGGSESARRRRSNHEFVAWLPVAMVVGLFAWAYYVYIFVFCGSLVKEGAQRFAFSTVFHLLLLLCLWSFVQTTVTAVPPIPGYFGLSESDQRLLEQCADDEARGEFLDILAENRGVLTRGTSGGVRFCERCQQVKPDRAHHCSQCLRCVPKMDHHCPWFNKCVCFSTYKFFLLTIFYVVALCVFGLASATHHVADAWSSNASTYVTLNCTFLYAFGVMLVLVLGSFLYLHFIMVCNNVTTLEDLRPHLFKDDRDSFDIGFRCNIAEVFGHRKALWFLPVFTSLGDGARFPTRLHPDRYVYGPPVSVMVEERRPSVPVPPLPVADEVPELPVLTSCRRPVPSTEGPLGGLTLTPFVAPPRGSLSFLPPTTITIVPPTEAAASVRLSESKKDLPPIVVASAFTSMEVR